MSYFSAFFFTLIATATGTATTTAPHRVSSYDVLTIYDAAHCKLMCPIHYVYYSHIEALWVWDHQVLPVPGKILPVLPV